MKLNEAFSAPLAKLNRITGLLDEVDMTKPEVRELICRVIANRLSFDEIDHLAVDLSAHHKLGDQLRNSVIRKRLGKVGGYNIHQDRVNAVDELDKFGKMDVKSQLNLIGLTVGANGYSALNTFKTIQALRINSAQPIMKLFSSIKIPVHIIWIEPADTTPKNFDSHAFTQLVESWEYKLDGNLGQNPISKTELLKMQTQLIEVGDFDDFVTEL